MELLTYCLIVASSVCVEEIEAHRVVLRTRSRTPIATCANTPPSSIQSCPYCLWIGTKKYLAISTIRVACVWDWLRPLFDWPGNTNPWSTPSSSLLNHQTTRALSSLHAFANTFPLQNSCLQAKTPTWWKTPRIFVSRLCHPAQFSSVWTAFSSWYFWIAIPSWCTLWWQRRSGPGSRVQRLGTTFCISVASHPHTFATSHS